MNIDDLDPDTVHDMLVFIYKGMLDNLGKGKAERLLTAAEKYDLKTLKQMCEELLCEKIDTDNVLELLLLSDLNRAPTLRAQAVKYILAHGKQVVSQSGWREKLEMYPDIICDLFEAATNKPGTTS